MEILTTVYDAATVFGVPLLVFVIGLVQWIKSFGLEGKKVRALAMGVSLLLGTGYQFSVNPPTNFAQWFGVAVFGLGLGLVSSGLYDANQKNK